MGDILWSAFLIGLGLMLVFGPWPDKWAARVTIALGGYLIVVGLETAF